jgi:protoporphyrinogen/coproporphyrinogen III oxidase
MKVVVVGAGIAGLGAATFFARKGHDVTVFEADDRVGGRARVLERPGSSDRCDVGTQYYHSSYRLALSLMDDVGLRASVRTVAGKTRFFDERVGAGSFDVGHRLPWIRPAGVMGNVRIGAFLLRHVLGNPMSTFALEDRPHLDGVRALDVLQDPWLREFVVRTLVLVGGLSEPEPTDVCLLQILRLVRIVVLTDYLTLPAGTASLHEALAARLPVRLSCPVSRVVVERGRAVGIELSGSGRVESADHVVVATTPPVAAGMLPASWDAERSFLGAVRLAPAFIVSLFLDRPIKHPVWSYMYRPSPERLVAFVTDASKKEARMVPSGKSILQGWICHPQAERHQHLGDEEIIARCIAQLAETFPDLAGQVEHAVVTRHAGGTPWHSVGHHGRALRFLESADARAGISFVGDYFSGGYLEPALWSAERAALRYAG